MIRIFLNVRYIGQLVVTLLLVILSDARFSFKTEMMKFLRKIRHPGRFAHHFLHITVYEDLRNEKCNKYSHHVRAMKDFKKILSIS